jgi:hypothetical protein
MSSDELLSTALRVMGRHMDHKDPSPQDVNALRNAAAGRSEAEAAIDVLAGRIIDEELQKSRSRMARTVTEIESDRAS